MSNLNNRDEMAWELLLTVISAECSNENTKSFCTWSRPTIEAFVRNVYTMTDVFRSLPHEKLDPTLTRGPYR